MDSDPGLCALPNLLPAGPLLCWFLAPVPLSFRFSLTSLFAGGPQYPSSSFPVQLSISAPPFLVEILPGVRAQCFCPVLCFNAL